jgi:hypothetical protein
LLGQLPTPNLEDKVSVFMTPRDRVAQLYPQALDTHFSRLLRHAWVTVGLFLVPATTLDDSKEKYGNIFLHRKYTQQSSNMYISLQFFYRFRVYTLIIRRVVYKLKRYYIK